ncbi:MAG: DUF692 family multinuclear iron-containing protein [Planctomycetota bacterium]
MSRPLCGIALPNDRGFLQRCERLVRERAELFELTPETLWQRGGAPGAGHAAMRALVTELGRPVVGHGVTFGVGDAAPSPRRAEHLQALVRDRAAFGFAWYSEHLGFVAADALYATLPLPMPATDDAVACAAAGLRALQAVHPVVAFENNADLFCLGDPLAQPLLFERLCSAADAWLLLDLHNAFAFCQNLGVDLDAWLDRVPWSRVLEIHLSGGSPSDPEWLPSRRVLRLDSHDGAVPEPVWRAFGAALPRATALRAVVLEWLPDGMTAEHADVFTADFERARSRLC